MNLQLKGIVTLSTKDLLGKASYIGSNREHIISGLDWLKKAQDITNDGGVSAYYSLVKGWQPSFVETTGYIISTFISSYEYLQNNDLKQRVVAMADFLVDMQLENGGFRSRSVAEQAHSEPKVFDTGQDILGMIAVYKFTKNKKYLESAVRAANFLCRIQNNDGSWTKYSYGGVHHVYHTRVAWALIETSKVTKNKSIEIAARKNLNWAMTKQNSKGWFSDNNFPPPNPHEPYTHTISYAIEGLLFSGVLLKEDKYINAAKKTADKIFNFYLLNSWLPGTFDSRWRSKDQYTCLTGNAQIAYVWMVLYELNFGDKYYKAAKKMINFLKANQDIKSLDSNIRGGIKGSFPIYGQILPTQGYCRLAYLNWATKFFIDLLLKDEEIENHK